MRVLEQDGLAKLTTGRIAEVAGVSIGSLYQYFPSKEAILGTLLERRFDDLLALVRGLLDSTLAVPIEVAIRSVVRGLIENQQHVGAALHAPYFESHSAAGRTDQFRGYLAQFIALLAAYFERRRTELGIADPQTAAFILVHCSEGVAQGLAYAPRADERLIADCTDLVMRYLLPYPARV